MGIARSPACRTSPINFAASGDNTIIAAVTAAPIKVYGLFFTVAGATNITFKDGTTALSGPIVFTNNGSSQQLNLWEEPWFYCQPGDAFVMNNSNAVQVSGIIYYTQP